MSAISADRIDDGEQFVPAERFEPGDSVLYGDREWYRVVATRRVGGCVRFLTSDGMSFAVVASWMMWRRR